MAFAYTKLMQAMVAAGVVSATDPYFNLVTLLLPGNGTNGAQNNTFLDSSTNNFTITRNGNTTQGTFSPFSQTGWSNYFDGSSAYLTLADNVAFEPGTGDFTIEAWVYDTVAAGTLNVYIAHASSGVSFYRNASGKLEFAQDAVAALATSTNNIPVNSWNHIAVSRSGTSLKLFINGVQEASVTNSTNLAGTGSLGIGASSNGSNKTTGYISNLRLVKGTAVYTASFTPPTAALTAISGTSLLTCQDNRFRDASSNAFAITVNGTPSVQPFSPFTPTAAYSAATNGGSGYFDGTGDYLTSSGDFFSGQGTARTFQCWIYVVSMPGAGTSQGIFSGANSGGNLSFRYDSSGTLKLDNTGTVEIATSASGAIKTGQWTHVAVTRTTGNLYTLYVNGSSVGSGTNSTNMGSSTYLASLTGGSTLNGYMTDIRVTNTVETINVPTAPLTAISGTALLLNFTNAGITDATAKNDLETVGNAQISTTQSKFGGSSMYFDGTGDYITFPASQNFNLTTGNFTIECWFYYSATPPSGSDYDYLWGIGANNTNGLGLYIQGGVPKIWNGSLILTTTGSISATTWYHLAVVRSSGTLTVYLNGTSIGSVSMTSDLSGGASVGFNIARWVNAADVNEFTGYIDDLRITKGYARYTANFTAPTAAFALQ